MTSRGGVNWKWNKARNVMEIEILPYRKRHQEWGRVVVVVVVVFPLKQSGLMPKAVLIHGVVFPLPEGISGSAGLSIPILRRLFPIPATVHQHSILPWFGYKIILVV